MACYILPLLEKGEAMNKNGVLGRSPGSDSLSLQLGFCTSGANMIFEKKNFTGHGPIILRESLRSGGGKGVRVSDGTRVQF